MVQVVVQVVVQAVVQEMTEDVLLVGGPFRCLVSGLESWHMLQYTRSRLGMGMCASGLERLSRCMGEWLGLESQPDVRQCAPELS